eukprot:491297-Ditylum_brightwellii.AAC.1
MELEVPKKSQQWRTVDLPKEILHYLTIRNRGHFGQAKGTPFMIPPLSQYFDLSAKSPVSEMVLNEDFNLEDVDKLQKLFIQYCKMETSDNLIGKKITKEQ